MQQIWIPSSSDRIRDIIFNAGKSCSCNALPGCNRIPDIRVANLNKRTLILLEPIKLTTAEEALGVLSHTSYIIIKAGYHIVEGEKKV